MINRYKSIVNFKEFITMSDIRKWKALVESASKVLENDTEDMAHTDHEVSMAKSQLLSAVKSSTRIAKQLQDKSEEEGLEGWVASKLTMAEDYLQAVADHMDGQEITEGYKVMPPMDPKYVARKGLEGPFTTLSGKVVYYDPKEGKYYDPDTDIYLSYDEFQNYDKDYSGMKDERDEVKEAGGYYTQPVYDMIKQHGYPKVMHKLLTALDADVIQSFLQRADLDESGLRPSFAQKIRNAELNKDKGPAPTGKTTGPDDYDFLKYKNKKKEVTEADETKYGIVRYPDTAISYIKNDGNGWEHIFDKSYGFEGPVDKEDLQYAKKIAKEKIPSRMLEATGTCECGCDCGKDVCESCGKKHSVNEGPFGGVGKQLMKRKLNKQHKKSDLANFDKSGIDTSGKTPDEIGQMKSDFYHDHMDKAARAKKAGDRLSGKNKVKESTEMMTEEQFDEAAGEKDACYRKVKSRYKVWPSAYASGALVKCRKVGAKNWGNSKK